MVTAQPSQRYLEMMQLYARLHLEGDVSNNIPPERVFDGRNLTPHIEFLASTCRRFNAKSLIDYGYSKAQSYAKAVARMADGKELTGLLEIWDLDSIQLYDPALRSYAALPEEAADIVLSTAVLEYTPEEDVPWVLSELFQFAKQLVFVTLATFPSRLMLPNGENYHVTQQSPGWWTDQLVEAQRSNSSVRFMAVMALSDDKNIRVEG